MSDIDLINQQPRKAHPNSVKYMRNLSEQHDDTAMVAGMPEQWKTLYYAVLNGSDNIAHKDVDTFITQLKKCPKRPVCGPGSNPNTTSIKDHMYQVPTPPPGTPREHWRPEAMELQDGMYLIPGRHGEAGNAHIPDTFYKVYHTVHGNNVQVAKRLIIAKSGTLTKSGANDGPLEVKVKFKYEGRAPLKFLKPEMRLTLEQAKEFGALYGTCCICGRTLTNELSIHIGIGPVCGRRQFGGDFEFQINQAKVDLGMTGKGEYVNGDVISVDYDEEPESAEDIQARLAEIDQELNQ